MSRRSWMSADENATAAAITALLKRMPDKAREAVLDDVERNADPEALAEIHDIIMTEKIIRRRA